MFKCSHLKLRVKGGKFFLTGLAHTEALNGAEIVWVTILLKLQLRIK